MRLGVVAALLWSLPGCGSGGSAAGETADAMTKAQLLKAGNAICRRGNDEIRENEARFLSEHRADDIRGAMENVLPVRRKEFRLLQELGTPAEDSQRLEEMLAGMKAGIEKAEEDPHSLLAGGPDYAFYEAYRIGIDYGLVKCWLG